MFVEYGGSQLLASIGELVEWESVVCHLIALVILTVGLYILLFKPVKRMIRERQEKIKKIEKENSDLNAEVNIVSGARAQAKSLVERTEQELDEERRSLQSDIERQISDVSLAVAEKILRRDITPEDDKKMIADSLAEWSKDQ